MLLQTSAVPHVACAVPVSARGMDVSLMMDWLGLGRTVAFLMEIYPEGADQQSHGVQNFHWTLASI